jgi:hypothetical protein
MSRLTTRRFTGAVIGLLLVAGVLSGCAQMRFPSSEDARGGYGRTDRSDGGE